MIDLKLVRDGKTHEEYQAHLKSLLDGDPRAREGRPLNLINRIRSRIQEGMSRNFDSYKVYYALDQAWNTPFRQLTPTLIGCFTDADVSKEEVTKLAQSLGLTQFITEEIDQKSGKATGKKIINLPLFFNVIVPLVRAYVVIRWAKIMNDRRLIPFFKYDPAKVTAMLRAKCDVLTDRVQVMSNQYGYYDVTKQSVLKMLHYSYCLQFIKEEWHSESQWRYATEHDAKFGKKTATGQPAKVGDKIKVTEREGLRYHHPHPTRTFWDINHGKYTINYDSGCEFLGYWRITRYRDLFENESLWSRDRIPLGATDIVDQQPAFFQTVYASCQLRVAVCKPPQATQGEAPGGLGGSGLNPNDREKTLAQQFYGSDYMDQGVLVTEYFEKLIPKDNGLGDYDCPVWFRFLVAGDSATILYAAPMVNPPAVYYGYDADESQMQNPSMSLEVLPFQDHFSNMLSQIILTAKQNLANAVFVDKDQLDEKDKKVIEGVGEKLWRALNIFGYSSRTAARGQNKIADVAHSVTFPKGNVAELTNVLKTILDVLERVLVMSAQEVAQAASHEQTREEIRNIASTTSNRLQFTATPVDIARDAWKRQIYCSLMAYGDDDFYAMIPSELPLDKEALEALGFTFLDKDVPMSDRYARVSAKKEAVAMPLWTFASTRDGDDRLNDQQTAQALAMLWDKVMTNPITSQAVGAEQALEWANAIAKLAGIDRDFKLRAVGPSPQEQQDEAQQMIQELKAQMDESTQKAIEQASQPILQKIQQQDANLGEIVSTVQAILKQNPDLNPTLETTSA